MLLTLPLETPQLLFLIQALFVFTAMGQSLAILNFINYLSIGWSGVSFVKQVEAFLETFTLSYI